MGRCRQRGALIAELLRPPDAPVLLFLGAYRSEDRRPSPFLQALFPPSAVPRDARVPGHRLPRARRAAAGTGRGPRPGPQPAGAETGPAGRDDLVEAIVRESGGNPFFVSELVRHVQGRRDVAGLELALDAESVPGLRTLGPSSSTRLALDEVLWSRDPPAPRRGAARAGDHRRRRPAAPPGGARPLRRALGG